jgi:4-hydroxybenzoate polyprenyltransferase
MLAAYARERLPVQLLLPASVGLALVAVGLETPATLSVAVVTAGLLVAQFRIWDDLADRHRDTMDHPDRVLVNADSVTPVRIACAGLTAANFGWVFARDGFGASLALLIALNGGAGVWYARRGVRTAAADHLLLAKYPAIVAIVAGTRLTVDPARTLLAMVSAYLAACVYEAWHDRTSPAGGHRLLLASEGILLVISLAALSMGGLS